MKCLFNTTSNKEVVGYCKYHNCGITKNQIACKHCCEKQCYHFVKNEKSNYWKEQALKKQRRKDRKKRINEYVNQFTNAG